MEFQTLPEQVKEWLASEKLTYLIIDLNKKIGIKDEQESLIASLVYSITTKEITPEEINQILVEEKIGDENIVKLIRQTMRDVFLRPIQPFLNNLGVDIEKIAVGLPILSIAPVVTPPPTTPQLRPADQKETLLTTPPVIPAPIKPAPTPPPVDLRNKPLAQSRPELNPPRPTPVKPAPASDQPFILHRESGSVSIPPKTAQPAPVAKPPSPLPTHPQTVNLRAPSQNQTPTPAPKPPAPPTQPEKPKEDSAKRTVHYSGPVTKIE